MDIKIDKETLKKLIRLDDYGYYSLIASCPDEIGLKDIDEKECCEHNCEKCWLQAIEEGDKNE